LKILENIIEFEWDDGNIKKNLLSHNVNVNEIEEVFFNEPLLIFNDIKHSNIETRYFVLG
jgi:uncharacterized protein